MEKNVQNLDDLLTCSICVEVFRDPVSLPCQHSYCRSCLESFADQSNTSDTDDEYGSKESQANRAVILSCPLCRKPANLGIKGVTGLPGNFHLAEIAEKTKPKVERKDTSLACSVCEDDAIRYCLSCSLLYCEDCLPVLHPKRGALKSHTLVSIDEYQSGAAAKGLELSKTVSEESKPTLSCDQHGQPFSIYCVTCHKIICIGCLGNHTEHSMRDVQSACEKQKEPLVHAIQECQEGLAKLEESMTGLMTLNEDIQYKEDRHTEAVEKGHRTAQEALDAWRRKSLEEVKKRYSGWHERYKVSLKDLQANTEKMKRLLQSSTDLLSSMDIAILQGSQQLTTKIENQLTEIRASCKQHEGVNNNLFKSLRLDGVVQRHIEVKEIPPPTAPLLWSVVTSKMVTPKVNTISGVQKNDKISEHYLAEDTKLASRRHREDIAEQEPPSTYSSSLDVTKGKRQTNKPQMKFNDSEGKLEIVRDCSGIKVGNISDWCEAWADGRMRTFRSYWEIRLTVSPKRPSFCYIGVSREGCSLWGNTDTNSWWIKLTYQGIEVFFGCECQGGISPPYTEGINCPGGLSIGVYLDCEAATLTFVHVTSNQVIGTVTNVDVSQPVVPSIRFGHVKSASASLVTGRFCTIPQILSDIQ